MIRQLTAAALLIVLGACNPLAIDSIDIPLRGTFESTVPPLAPDYSHVDAWAALPEMVDPADLVPANTAVPNRQAEAKIDIFFIHPTTELSKAFWNSPYNDIALNEWTDNSVIARQASVFNAAGRIFAPRYRQGASGSGVFMARDGGPALSFAYQDVRRAFEYYLQHRNNDRPFILAGHSQGAFHAERLLRELIDQSDLRHRLVAAYLVGIPLHSAVIEIEFQNLKLCREQDEVGCLMSWNSYLSGTGAGQFSSLTADRAKSIYGDAIDPALSCTNPLTFDLRRPDAAPAANLGALPGKAGREALQSLIANAAGASCENGILLIDPQATKRLEIEPLPDGFMHYHDYSLFYENIRLNAVARSRAFLDGM